MSIVRSILGLTILVPQIVLAEEPLGQILGFLDGEEIIWHTIVMDQGGEGVATADFRQSARYADLYLQGHLEPRFVSKGMLSVEARYEGQFALDAEPTSVEIIYMPNGLGGQFFTTRGTTPAPWFQILDFSVWGTSGTILAAFSGELCAAWMNRPRDPTDCKTLEGQVTTRLFIDEAAWRAYPSIASNSSIKPEIIDKPLSQNAGSLASNPKGASSSLWCFEPPAFSMSKYLVWKSGSPSS